MGPDAGPSIRNSRPNQAFLSLPDWKTKNNHTHTSANSASGSGKLTSSLLFQVTKWSNWPSYLWTIVVTAFLVWEASEVILGQEPLALTLYQVKVLLELKGHLWMTGERFTKTQAILTENLSISLQSCTVLIPVTVFPTNMSLNKPSSKIVPATPIWGASHWKGWLACGSLMAAVS